MVLCFTSQTRDQKFPQERGRGRKQSDLKTIPQFLVVRGGYISFPKQAHPEDEVLYPMLGLLGKGTRSPTDP